MKEDNTSHTLTKISEGIYKEKGSKFIAYAMPIASKDEVKDIVNRYKKEHHKAKHVCFAYRIGQDIRANDNGEPSGTAVRKETEASYSSARR